MSHRAAEDLSDAIDRWLTRTDLGRGEGLEEIIDTLGDGLPPVADQDARERVRRRLAAVSPRPRSSQEILLERAFDEVDRLQHRLREDEYVPWSAVATAAVIVVGAVGLAVWLRRRGIDQPITVA
ncbi:MAG TPA: hypothetical protein VGR61_06515 [Candidatus Dormibacteraeota bacterium]|nr:hypothetical protein [Candidatus Dormibacteraeota bacterium]